MTKIQCFLFLAFFTFTTSLTAQFGIKLGINGSAVGSYGNSEEGEDADLKLGFQAGLLYKFSLTDKINLMTELNFEARGTVSKKDYSISLPVAQVAAIGVYDIKQEANSVQNYINIPILAVFGSNKLKFYAGPNIGFLVSGKADFDRTIDITVGGTVINDEINLKDVDWLDYDSFKNIFVTPPAESGNFLNSFEFGINVGAMFDISEKLFVDLRVSQGLTDTSNNDYDNSIYPDESFQFESRSDTDRNLSIQLGVGYMF